MTIGTDLTSFKQAYNRISQRQLNMQNNAAPLDFDVVNLVSEKVSQNVISNYGAIFSASDLYNVKQRVGTVLSGTLKGLGIGDTGYFGGTQNTANMAFLYDSGSVLDLARPLSQNLASTAVVGNQEMATMSTLVTDYDTFMQTADRPRLDAITAGQLETTQGSLTGIRGALRALKTSLCDNGVVFDSDRNAILSDLTNLFLDVTGADNLFISVQRYVTDILTQSSVLTGSLQSVLGAKDSTENFVDNFVNDVNLTSFLCNVFDSSLINLDSLSEDITASINQDNKYNNVVLQSQIARDLQSAVQSLEHMPEDVESKINAAPAKPAYDTLKTDLLAVPNTNVQSVLDTVDDLVKKAQILVVRDITGDFSVDVGTFNAAVSNATADLNNIQSTVKVYTPSQTTLGQSLENTASGSGLDKLQDTLTSGQFQEYSTMLAHTSTYAGKLADSLAADLKDIPADQGGKNEAWHFARNTMVGIHQTAMIAARAIKQEIPGAVSTLSKEEENIDKAIAQIEQYL